MRKAKIDLTTAPREQLIRDSYFREKAPISPSAQRKAVADGRLKPPKRIGNVNYRTVGELFDYWNAA